MIKNSQYSATAENLQLKFIVSNDTDSEWTDVESYVNHTHGYFELFCCTVGTLNVKVFDEKYLLQPGDILIIPPLVPHSTIYTEPYPEWAAASFFISKRRSSGSHDLYSHLINIVNLKKPTLHRGMIRICRQIVSLSSRPNVYKFPALKLLSVLLDIADTRNIPSDSDFSDNVICDLESFINAEFMNPLSVKDIANRLNISERHLSRIVNARYGECLHKVILNKRLDAAAKMLQKTGLSTEEICHAVGFRSISSFYKEFKKSYGETPYAYRRNK